MQYVTEKGPTNWITLYLHLEQEGSTPFPRQVPRLLLKLSY